MSNTTKFDSRLQLLLRLVESITASPDLDHVLESVVRSAASLVEGSRATLWIVEGGRLVVRARLQSRRRSDVPCRGDLALGEGLAGHAALERRTLLVPDVLTDPRTVNRAYHEAEELRASAVIPLISHGRLVGVLELLTSRAADLGSTEVEMLTAFAGHAAIAIDSAGLYADTERRRREAEILADIARDLAEQRDVDAILARIARGAHALCGGDVTSLALRDGDGSFPARFMIGARSEAYRNFRVVPGLGIGGRAAVDGRPVRTDERVAWPPMSPEYAAAIDAEGIRSALVVPIVVDQHIDGLLYVCSRLSRSFSEADETVLVRLADHAAAAIRTARLFAAEQVARSEAQELVDTLDAIVLDADAETFQISFVNKRAEAILGYPVEAWYADPQFWVHHVHPDDRDTAAAACSTAIAEGRDHVLQYRMLAADGRVVWVHDMVRVLRRGTDGRRQLRSVMVDITERKQAELEVQQQRQVLAHLTRVATLGELSGALAHELSQPLTSILTNAQAALLFLAREPADLAEIRAILEDIVHEDRRAAEFIRRLRALLRRGETPRQPLDLHELSGDVLRLLHSELVTHGVAVSMQVAPGLPKVNGDPVSLQQVLLNLIINACDAMRSTRPPERRVDIAIGVDGDSAVRVAVADRGTGLPSDVQRLFEPFFTTKVHGLGLGLVICQSIVTAHGGHLSAHNNSDGGATFSFTLPTWCGADPPPCADGVERGDGRDLVGHERSTH